MAEQIEIVKDGVKINGNPVEKGTTLSVSDSIAATLLASEEGKIANAPKKGKGK